MNTICLLAGLLAYIVTCRAVMRRLTGGGRELAFAALNLAGVFTFLFYGGKEHYMLRFGIYVALIVALYLVLCLFADKRGGWPWLAFFAPIAALIVVRYVPSSVYVALGQALGKSWRGVPNMVGISYLAFRCSRLVLEVRNGVVKKPNFLEYLNFAFFLPTMPVGPINNYANFRRGFEAAPYDVPMGRAALRILIGAVKYQFLGNLCNQLTYSGLLLDDHPHRWIDLPVATLFYYLYLYLNFSGFCDMAIGAAAIIGIPVPENFENPLAARNMREFWNRWHITLSAWMRDLVFSPLSKFLVRVMGVNLANHAVALAILVTFLLIGIWHGAGWNYAAFGLAQAFGVAAVYYYTIFLKKRLGRDGFKAYNENRWIRAVAVVFTFCYYAMTLFLFANTFPEMKEIFSVLR
ncbi:MAG: MBOAT family O-acyltransferase [Verrucomicrobiota bacterium]|jgi:D-alanyl-lipoteichoic acid acyltransferase DltB (MBOAT superfamily)